MSAAFHSGEDAVQSRAGVSDSAARAGRRIRSTIPRVAADFMELQRFAVLGASDPRGQVWASLFSGDKGFIRRLDRKTVRMLTELDDYDPLTPSFIAGCDAGIVVVDFATRRRMRMNGRARMFGKALVFQTNQVYSNCSQFIKERFLEPGDGPREESFVSRRSFLSGAQQDWIRWCETFFIATYHPKGGGDASHRGGLPGFVEILDDNKIRWRDYLGHGMMNTLGNLHSNPSAGLLFVDFERGRTLQLTGTGKINWSKSRSERSVTFDVKEVIEIRGVCQLKWHDTISEQ